MRTPGDRLPINLWTLRFESEELERDFRAGYFAAARRQSRVALALVFVLYALFSFLDWVLIPDLAAGIGWIRAGVCTLAVALIALSFAPIFDRFRQELLGGFLVVAAGAIVVMIVVGGRSVEQFYYVGLILAVLGTYTVFRLRFPVAVAITLGIIIAYEIAAIAIVGTAPAIVVNNNFFLLSATILATFAGYTIEKSARRSYWQGLLVEEERRRSDNLLLNILPAPIAERLKKEQGPIAEAFDEASILFADIVGFTEMSSRMAATQLVRLLNRVFTEFDHIVFEHGLEKIKTIGDAYMAAAGLPMRRKDHAERVAEAALAMRERIRALGDGAGTGGEWEGSRGPRLEIRVGIATGPVVAGVIGQSKFIYDLWGDAVTTASRMESHGVPGRIQVTEATYERLRERYTFSRREGVEVKGKGRMITYMLEGRK